jgi:hypothetical protein
MFGWGEGAKLMSKPIANQEKGVKGESGERRKVRGKG